MGSRSCSALGSPSVPALDTIEKRLQKDLVRGLLADGFALNGNRSDEEIADEITSRAEAAGIDIPLGCSEQTILNMVAEDNGQARTGRACSLGDHRKVDPGEPPRRSAVPSPHRPRPLRETRVPRRLLPHPPPQAAEGRVMTHHRQGDDAMTAPVLVTDSGPKSAESVACRMTGCDRPVKAHDLCGTHYQRQRRTGDPAVTRRPGRPWWTWETGAVYQSLRATVGPAGLGFSKRTMTRYAHAIAILSELDANAAAAIRAATRANGSINVAELERIALAEVIRRRVDDVDGGDHAVH